MLTLWATLLLSLVLLLVSGDRVVTYGKRIASSIGMSSFFFALLFVALGTSLPELAVGLISALEGYPDVVLGDILGSNVADLFLILSFYALLLRRNLPWDLLRDLTAATSFTGIAFTYALFRGIIGPLDGLLLLALFFLFVRSRLPSLEMEDRPSHLRSDVPIFLLSLATLVLASYVAVKSVTALSFLLSIPPFVISFLTLALGTSLPELAVGLSAIRRGEYRMALGDVVGSLVVNTTLGLGLPALITPLPVLLWEERFTIFLLLFGLFLLVYVLQRGRLDERYALLALPLYLLALLALLVF